MKLLHRVLVLVICGVICLSLAPLSLSVEKPTKDIVELSSVETLNPDIIEQVEEEFEETENKSFDINLTFIGDCTLGGNTFNTYTNPEHSNYKEPEYFLEKVKHYFEADDFTIANLECVLSDKNLSSRDKGSGRAFWFKGKTSNTEILTSSSVEIVSIANNHTNDYGSQGMKDTIEAVVNAGMDYGYNDHTVYFEKNGFVIALICHGLWSEWQANEIIERIHEASSQSDFQIVYYHGGTESQHVPEEWRVRASRKLVDYGADLVIGNHPHVLQPMEIYHGVNIIYSMGNFCFGGNRRPENYTMIYQFQIHVNDGDKNKIITSGNAIPCYVYTGDINNYQPEIITYGPDKDHVFDLLSSKNLPY